MKETTFWDIAQCSFVEADRRLEMLTLSIITAFAPNLYFTIPIYFKSQT
jgi:hypothetical protein